MKAQLLDQLAEQNGQAEFLGLFRRSDGSRIKARKVMTHSRYDERDVPTWLVLDKSNEPMMWIPAEKNGSTRSKLYKLGLEEKMEMVPAKVDFRGSRRKGTGSWRILREDDRGYPDGAVYLEVQ